MAVRTIRLRVHWMSKLPEIELPIDKELSDVCVLYFVLARKRWG
jgi:hypothetical protein